LLAERIKDIEKIKVQDRTSDEKRELKKLKMKRSRGKKNESPEKRRPRLDAVVESNRKRR